MNKQVNRYDSALKQGFIKSRCGNNRMISSILLIFTLVHDRVSNKYACADTVLNYYEGKVSEFLLVYQSYGLINLKFTPVIWIRQVH